MTINQDMKALHPYEKVLPEYLLYILKGLRDMVLDLVESSAHGTRVLRTELFEKMEIPLPPLDEQEAIINEVKRATARIGEISKKAQQAIQLLTERRATLISAAVTGKIDVRGWKPASETD